MNVFRNMAIKHKLIFIIMLTCITGLVLTGGALIGWEKRVFCDGMVKNLSTQAAMTAENCKAALAFQDAEDAKKTLQVLYVEPSIVLGCVYDKNNQLFAAYYRDNIVIKIQPAEIQNSGYKIKDGYLTVFKPIVLDEEIVGTVCLRSDMSPMYEMLKRNISIIITVLFVSSLAAFLLSSRLQKIISEPILKLADVAKTVSEKKDYSTRAIKHSSDEVGWLIDAFNEMLSQIQHRDLELVDTKGKLEVRVNERTEELSNANHQLQQEIEVRKKAEERQSQLLEQLEKVNEELKEFAYVVSHDLKAPLRGIKTLVDWITNDYADKLDDDGKEQMNLLENRVDRMHNLIDGILQYSRVGRVSEEKVKVNLNELVSDVIDMLAPPENITITIENELPTIECEQIRMMQVFQNLMSNAVKYMDKPQGRIKVGCTEENEFLKFSVSDNGPGIEEKYYDRIFQMFQTLSPRDEFESTGIGLTVVKKIVELYSGKIWVKSKVGEGSTFFFTLPKQETGVRDEKLETNIVS